MPNTHFCWPYNRVAYSPTSLEDYGNYIIVLCRFNFIVPERFVECRVKCLTHLTHLLEPECGKGTLELLGYRQEASWHLTVLFSALECVESREEGLDGLNLASRLCRFRGPLVPAQEIHVVSLGALPAVHILLLLLPAGLKLFAHLSDFIFRPCLSHIFAGFRLDFHIIFFIHLSTMPEISTRVKTKTVSRRAAVKQRWKRRADSYSDCLLKHGLAIFGLECFNADFYERLG